VSHTYKGNNQYGAAIVNKKPITQSNSNMDFSYTSNAANSIIGKGGGFFPNLRAKQRDNLNNNTYHHSQTNPH
jgi:hypothetical protein